MDEGSPVDEVVARQLDGELRLVHAAILMVAVHGAPRVFVAGLRRGEAILDQARRQALESGVRVTPIRSADDRVRDIQVEALRP